MKQVIEEMKTGTVKVVETPAPRCGAGQLLVRNVTSLISPGTEKLLIEMGRKTLVGKAMSRPDLLSLAYQKGKREGFLNVFREAMARLDQPITLGYSSAGEVMGVGASVRGFAIGDRVACAGYGFADHADVIAVPSQLCVKLDDAVSFEEASFVMLGAIALHGLRCAEITFGENVVVVGLGLLGLLTVQIAQAYGCRVIGMDIDRSKVGLAAKLGCNSAIHLTKKDDPELTIQNLTEGHGADAVLLTVASKDNAPILLAERIARKRGRIVLVGVSDITLTRKAFWDKELSFAVSKASGPSADSVGSSLLPLELVRWTEGRNLREVIRLISSGALNVKSLITHRYAIDSAVAAYDMILKGKDRYIGVLLTYPTTGEIAPLQHYPWRKPGSEAPSSPGMSRRNVGYIGAGLFTRNFLFPRTRSISGVTHVGIASQTAISARNAAEKFKFGYATTDHQQLLKDPSIGSIFVTTRHNLHGRFIVEALEAGKSVFVEKPLCISMAELEEIQRAYRASPNDSALMVGFNRRFSPLATRLKAFIARRTSPLQMIYRVNAGYLPPDHWTQDPAIGGGRIIGEVCHFIDFFLYLTGSEPLEVSAASIDGEPSKYLKDDNVSLTLRFADGSLGTIIYTSLGSKTFSRERAEIYSEETVGILEDFRTLELVKGSRKDQIRLRAQDMGYTAELERFFSLDRKTSDELLRDAMLATAVTFSAVESLQMHRPVSVRLPGRSK